MTNYLEDLISKGLYEHIDGYEEEMVDEIGKLVAIPSLPDHLTDYGMMHGPEIVRCLEHTLELCRKLGFETYQDPKNRFGWAEVGEGEKLLTIFIHLDVVPVGDGWTREPFVMSKDGDYLYGRGTIDNKGPAVSTIYAIKSCCDYGVKWPCRVRIYFGTNEELGSTDVQLYIRENGAPDFAWVPDSQFPLSYSELNGTDFELRKMYRPENIVSDLKLVSVEHEHHANGIASWANCVLDAASEELARETADKANSFGKERNMDLTACAEGTCVKISSKGKVAYHWNEPWTGINATMQLACFLDTVSLGAEPDELIHFMVSRVGLETDGKGLGIDVKAETAELCLGVETMTLDSFGLAFGVSVLFPAEVRNEIIYNTVFRQTKPLGIDMVAKSMSPGFLLDKNCSFLQALYSSFCEVTGSNEPIKVCGGTYAKHVPHAVPFGAIFGPEQDICHTPDEHIRVKTELMVWTKIYANALLRVADHFEEMHN